ncbi:hypothetical protein [Hymenobacter antarcticus]|uniref:Uncharacterized protein n=1 Tax=Hymenobacter antarcticus TaxID=486270 RepID=A0ABP7R6W6_9BACT
MPNEFHTDIPAKVITDVQAHFEAIRTALAPYLLSLTPDERKTMLRMADKTVAFVTKTTDYATTNPSFVPAFVDLAELKQDTAGMAAFTPLRQFCEQLALDLDSTVMVAGSEAYGNALTVYGNIKFLAKNKQPGAQAAYDELSVRFPGNANAGRKPTPAKG